MSPNFVHKTQASTYQKVADYLKSSTLFQQSVKSDPDHPTFGVQYGSTWVDVEVLDWDFHPWENSELAIVKTTSAVTIGSQQSADLYQYLLEENKRMLFGGFQLDGDRILFSESILGGENMDLLELQTCIFSVVTIADTYDDTLIQRFGGQRAIDYLSASGA